MSPSENEQLRHEKLKNAAEKLNSVVQELVNSRGNDESFATACDKYTLAAKELAVEALGLRIFKKCKGLDEVARLADHDFLRRLENKITFSQEIRDILSPWRFAIASPDGQKLYQLFANSTGNPLGSFVLTRVGDTKGERIGSWGQIKDILSSMRLQEIPSEFFPKRSEPVRSR